MKKFFIILLCKILCQIGRLVGKGSSLPGKIALRLDPKILDKLTLCPYIIAVTGSNGKTSTVELIAQVLTSCGYRVAYNKEGSNQIEGVTTLLLKNATLCGRVRAQALVIESDERFARYTFSHFSPTHYVITNLYRDQLSRNGHPEMVFDCIRDSIRDPNTTLILNADDPLVALLAQGHEKTVWYGVEKTPLSETENNSIYDDGAFCPACKQRMVYDYYHYAHIGSYHCTSCGHHRPDPDYRVDSLDPEKGEMTINGQYRISLFLKSIYNVYNNLAAFTVACLCGADPEKAAAAVSDYVLKNGRYTCFRIGDRRGVLLTSKHENSVSYNQSIELALRARRPVTVVIIVDAISRKYYTGETSWLWDIDFEKLCSPKVDRVILAGRYCYDLACRFSYTEIPPERIELEYDVRQLPQHLRNGMGDIIVITCFSDRDKLLSCVERVAPEEVGLPF